MTTNISPELQNDLDKEAKAEAKKLTGRVPIFRMGYEAGHYDGAEKYVDKWQEAEQRATELRIISTKQRNLLEKFLSRHEAGLLPDRFIYDEIKNYLTHKTSSDGSANR